MKIYNKSLFLEGAFSAIVGFALFVSQLNGFKIQHLILAALTIFIGIGLILGSMSKIMSRENQIDQADERNQLIILKTKSRTLQITQMICIVFSVIFLIMGKLKSHILLIVFGTGLIIPFILSLFVEVFCHMYYELKY
ncbi:MAG: DUF2178 domain-containing protein [Lachnospiraceae bacterium]|nr:DUF2178 domain-containing protein [Lachnospiraceae bacterium]